MVMGHSSMPTLLLVDDDESTRMILCRFLRRAAPGLALAEAQNGEEAIRLLTHQAFDAVLSDYRMGLVTGIDVLAFAAKRHPQAIRVLMTGFADPALETAARTRAQVHAFIEKPMSTREFEQLLETHLLALLPTGVAARPEG